ncbi:MAG: AMP-binding protein, partial [Acetobacteraceae bacterium]
MNEFANTFVRQQLEATPDLISMLCARAVDRPDHPAVVFHRSPTDPAPWTLSYGELSTQVQAVVAGLRSADLEPSRGIAILSPSTPEAVAAFIGATAVGAAFPLNPLLAPEAMSAQLVLGRVGAAFVAPEHPLIDHQARLSAALGLASVVELLIELPLQGRASAADWRQLRGTWKPARAVSLGACALAADRPAALFHTGGTTGEPKLAELSARGLAAGALMSAAALNLQASDRIVIALPLFHVGGAITCTFATLAAGATAIFCGVLGAREPDLPSRIWNFLAATAATAVAMVPTSLGTVVKTSVADADLGRLRGVITGASPLSPRLASDLEHLLDVPVCQVFGMTELSGICTA